MYTGTGPLHIYGSAFGKAIESLKESVVDSDEFPLFKKISTLLAMR